MPKNPKDPKKDKKPKRPLTPEEILKAMNGKPEIHPLGPWRPEEAKRFAEAKKRAEGKREAETEEAKKAAEARRLAIKRQEEAKKAAEEEEARKKAAALRAQTEKGQQTSGPADLLQGLQNFLKNNLQGFGQIINFLKTWEKQSEQTFKDRNIIDGKPHTGGFGSALGKLLGVFSKIFEFIFGFFQSLSGNPAMFNNPAANLALGLANPTGPAGPAAPTVPTGTNRPTGPTSPVPSAPSSPIPTVGGPVPTSGSPVMYTGGPIPASGGPGLFFSNAGKTASNGPLQAFGKLASLANAALHHKPKTSVPGLDQGLGYQPSKLGGKPVPPLRT